MNKHNGSRRKRDGVIWSVGESEGAKGMGGIGGNLEGEKKTSERRGRRQRRS